MTRIALILGGLLVAGQAVRADSWPQFRGPGGKATADAVGLPDKWGDSENLRWKAELPGRGVSAPVIAGSKVFLTASSGMTDTRLHALCFDSRTGQKLWERQFWATGQTSCDPKTCMACPTPATDGSVVYCVFATGDAVALSAGGDVLWVRSLCGDYPKMSNLAGRSSSPLLYCDTLIVLMDNQGESYLLGLDTKTGQNRWKVNRPLEANWVTPLILERDGRADLLVSSTFGLAAYDPLTGQPKWNFADEKFNPISSPVVAGGDTVLVPLFTGSVAMKLASNAGPEVLWKSLKVGSGMSTPVAVNGKIFALSARDSLLVCSNLANGEIVWDQRVTGPFSASPVVADGKLYLVSEEGVCSVFRLGDKPDLVGKVEMKETILATPAIADGAIFIRSDKHLYCVGGKAKAN